MYTHRVPPECRTPSSKDPANTFGTTNLTPGIEVALVHGWIDLKSAFGQIQRGNRRVRQALESDIPRLLINLIKVRSSSYKEQHKSINDTTALPETGRRYSRKPTCPRLCKTYSTCPSKARSSQFSPELYG